MGRRQSGGDNSGVKKIMINNLCRETKNGDTLKDKDASRLSFRFRISAQQ